MTHKQASRILKALVAGQDPATGEALRNESVLQRAEVLRALLAGSSALDEQGARAARRASLPVNVGKPWTADEERLLQDAFEKKETPEQIATRLGRTLRAVESRLEQLGLLSASERATKPKFGSKV